MMMKVKTFFEAKWRFQNLILDVEKTDIKRRKIAPTKEIKSADERKKLVRVSEYFSLFNETFKNKN